MPDTITKIISNSSLLKPRLEAKEGPMEGPINSSRTTRHKTLHTIRINFKAIIRLNSMQMAELASNMALVAIRVALDSSSQLLPWQAALQLSLTGRRRCSRFRFSSSSVSTYLLLLTKST